MERCTEEHEWDGRRQELCWVDMFKVKMVQLYETTVVRHGLMVVGPTGGGKTCIIRILAHAQSQCADEGVAGFSKTRIFTLNPKSITMNQLYGSFDLSTGEWTDGIGATIFRHCAAPEPECGVAEEDKKWLLFDGPVDAVWIENMNTVWDIVGLPCPPPHPILAPSPCPCSRCHILPPDALPAHPIPGLSPHMARSRCSTTTKSCASPRGR